MKANPWSLLLVVIGLGIGLAFGSGVIEKQAPAQPPVGGSAGPATPRFQISAWGTALQRNLANPPEHHRGCYIIDAVTGEAWHAYDDGPPKKIWQISRRRRAPCSISVPIRPSTRSISKAVGRTLPRWSTPPTWEAMARFPRT